MAKRNIKWSAKNSKEFAKLAKELSDTIAKKLEAVEPANPKFKSALYNVGLILRNRMIMEATRQRIVNTGALRNSINFAVQGDKVIAGSFGVKYARFHEFGANLPPNAVRAMFANMRKMGGKKPRASKGIFQGNAQTGGKLLARPFVRTALTIERDRIRRELRKIITGG